METIGDDVSPTTPTSSSTLPPSSIAISSSSGSTSSSSSSTGVKRHGAIRVIAVLLIQACVGSFYSSSVFNKYMDSHVWHHPGSNAGMFTSCVAFYGLGTFFLGSWIGKYGAFYAVRRSLFLTPVGWGLASLAGTYEQLWLLYMGYGVFHGLGCAHAYISTTSLLQKWFPLQKGLVSGVAVCGAGVGSVIWTSLARALLDPKGSFALTPPQVQLVFAIVFFILLLVSLPFMLNPPEGWKPPPLVFPDETDTSLKAMLMLMLIRWVNKKGEGGGGEAASKDNQSTSSSSHIPPPHPLPPNSCTGPSFSLARDRDYTFKESVKQQEFQITAMILFCEVITGAVFLSSAADMVQNIFGYSADTAGLVTAYLNTANFTGRFIWGFVTDKIGRKSFWVLSGAVQCLALITMTQAIEEKSFPLWLMCFLLIGSLYGGAFPVIAALVSDLFGPSISSANHGVMIGVWALSVVIGVPIFSAVTAKYSIETPGGGVFLPSIVNGTLSTTISSPPPIIIKVPTPQAYIVNASWLAVLPMIAFILALVLNVRKEDRMLRKSLAGRGTGKALLARLPGGRVLACTCWLMDAQEQETEYLRAGARDGGNGGTDSKGGGGGMSDCNTTSSTALVVVAMEPAGGGGGGVSAVEEAGGKEWGIKGTVHHEGDEGDEKTISVIGAANGGRLV